MLFSIGSCGSSGRKLNSTLLFFKMARTMAGNRISLLPGSSSADYTWERDWVSASAVATRLPPPISTPIITMPFCQSGSRSEICANLLLKKVSSVGRRGLACGFIPNTHAASFAQQQASNDERQTSDAHRVVETGINIASGCHGRQSDQRQ